MRTSSAGIELIKEFEGKRLTAYYCPAGVLTIGYGHTSSAGEPQVVQGMKITEEEASEILKADLRAYERTVDDAVNVALKQHQFDALVSFCYNVGQSAFRKSTLVRRLNRGDHAAIPQELMKWTKTNGRELAGLVRRRRAEAKMWRGIETETPVNPNESRLSPEEPQPKKKITESREANVAAVAGSAATATAVLEAAPHVETLSDVLGRPVVLVLLLIAILCVAIWWFRKQRLEETGE
jgi:lysozyme